ncbi:MAG: hypothetical protein AB7P12_09945 [Alphaproteobacteria bacterium]
MRSIMLAGMLSAAAAAAAMPATAQITVRNVATANLVIAVVKGAGLTEQCFGFGVAKDSDVVITALQLAGCFPGPYGLSVKVNQVPGYDLPGNCLVFPVTANARIEVDGGVNELTCTFL